MGLPEIIIEFKTKGVTAIKRSCLLYTSDAADD